MANSNPVRALSHTLIKIKVDNEEKGWGVAHCECLSLFPSTTNVNGNIKKSVIKEKEAFVPVSGQTMN